MAATILQWNARGLRCNRRDFDILIGEHQPDVICLQETKLEHSPPLNHYRCANYDGYCKSLRRNPDQLPCGGVLIYIKKGLYHEVVQIDSHLQAIAVQVTGWCTCHCPFCLYPRQQPPHHQRSVKLDQRHKRPDTYHRWLQWTQLHVG